jgi:tungstate transport system ATP-binding protein
VALARALITQPDVLLLDEPTANLDPANVGIIEAIIQEENQRSGMTIVLVTHNIFQARRIAHRTALLWAGELIEVAPTEQFFNAPERQETAAFVHGDTVY